MADEVNEFLGGDTIDRVKDLAEAFGDNKDRILEAVDWVWDHREELIELTQRLPELLGQAGASLALAGDGALRASALLVGEDGDSVGGLTATAADALESCLGQITAAGEMIAGVGDQIDDVPMLDGVGGSLVKGAARLEGINEDLAVVADRLRAAGVRVTDAGDDLAEVGSGLRAGGAELASFAGRELPGVPTTGSRSPSRSGGKAGSGGSGSKGSSSGGLGLGKPT